MAMLKQLLPLVSILVCGCNLITGADDLSLVDTEPQDDFEAAVVVLEGEDLDKELATSPVHEAAAFARLGLMWDADDAAAFEVTTSADGRNWSGYSAPRVHHIELEEAANFVGQHELAEPARFWRVRGVAGATPTFVRVELLTLDQSQSVESGETIEEYAIQIGPASVHTRAEWNAKAASCSSSIGDVYRMAIHHTETPTNDSMTAEARLRQIQSYHRDVRGWCDIGYHYLMSRDGRLWEGRPAAKLGAHSGGANTGNLGISVMGMHDATPITDTQLSNVSGLVRGLADAEDVPLTRTAIKGHREYKSTTCPGDALFGQLGDIVDEAANGGGGNTPPPPSNGSCDPGTTKDGAWTCGGLTGTTTNPDGKYYTTSFGCWVDENGTPHSDAGDNCIPACSLASIGCSGMTGPNCERSINWYVAGSDRFGCGTRLRVTNPDNGKSAVLMAIDRGPNCSIENTVDYWVLDMSYRASHYLFGGPTSATEKADVQIQVVPSNTPLGPWTGGPCTNSGGTSTLKGYLYEGSNTTARIASGTVTLEGGPSTTTSSTGYWEFTGVATGTVNIVGSKSGYQTRTITRTVTSGENWASFGLSLSTSTPTGTAVLQGVVYHTTNSLNRIPNASISLSTGHTITADGNGYYKIYDLPAGPVSVTASASGWSTESVNRTLIDGETEWGSVRLY